jgi:hypothetical protein
MGYRRDDGRDAIGAVASSCVGLIRATVRLPKRIRAGWSKLIFESTVASKDPVIVSICGDQKVRNGVRQLGQRNCGVDVQGFQGMCFWTRKS